MINPETNPLGVAAKRGYLPIIEKADLTVDNAKILLKIASTAGNSKIVMYLDQLFSIFKNDIRIASQIAVDSVDRDDELMLNYLFSSIKSQNLNKIMYKIAKKAVRTGRYWLIEDLFDRFPTLRNILFKALVINGNEKSFPLLRTLYPPNYQPTLNEASRIVQFIPSDTKMDDNVGYFIKLTSRDPRFLTNLDASFLPLIINNIYNKEDLKPLLDNSIRYGKQKNIAILVKSVPELVDDNAIINASNRTYKTFRTLVNNLPHDYPYTTNLLEKLNLGRLRIIADYLNIINTQSLNKEDLITSILDKTKRHERV